MVHEGMANYYDFLNLQGYKRCHEYHYLVETLENRKIQHFYINLYNKLIPELEIDSSSVIPANWGKYARQDVDYSTKRSAVQTGVNQWVDWERKTREALKKAYRELCDLGEVSAAAFVLDMIKCNDKEIKKAEQKLLDLEANNYDMTYIIESQHRYHKKFKKKMKTLKAE